MKSFDSFKRLVDETCTEIFAILPLFECSEAQGKVGLLVMKQWYVHLMY